MAAWLDDDEMQAWQAFLRAGPDCGNGSTAVRR